MAHYYSNGKLLLTSEYLVLDGATALALPTKFGQSLEVEEIGEEKIEWKSLDRNSNIWFDTVFAFGDITEEGNLDKNPIEKRLKSILIEAKKLNPLFTSDAKGYSVITKLNFPKEWGLGTSSTLINNIANWAKVDPYKLLQKTFGGSGYDITCARSNNPVLYKIEDNEPIITQVTFDPPFKNHIYFVYLNKKQNSREGISAYRKRGKMNQKYIETANSISELILRSTTLEEFNSLIIAHENLISEVIGSKPIKEELFSNFDGAIKSLGAWGGDFIMVTSKHDPSSYFKEKGYETLLPYSEMILNQ